MPINIAIDGPSGAGKSTIAKAVSKKLGFIYVDTGALYRGVAYYMLSLGVSYKDSERVVEEIKKLSDGFFNLKFIDGSQYVFAGDEDVSDKIRTTEISMGASAVSAIPEIRAYLFELQRKIARENNIIMDGRDIGTVVLPEADLKIYLTATPEERAERRFKELSEKGDTVIFEQVLADIQKRDYDDMNREIAPLKQADDAILADTSNVDLEGAIELIFSIINEKCDV